MAPRNCLFGRAFTTGLARYALTPSLSARCRIMFASSIINAANLRSVSGFILPERETTSTILAWGRDVSPLIKAANSHVNPRGRVPEHSVSPSTPSVALFFFCPLPPPTPDCSTAFWASPWICCYCIASSPILLPQAHCFVECKNWNPNAWFPSGTLSRTVSESASDSCKFPSTLPKRSPLSGFRNFYFKKPYTVKTL